MKILCIGHNGENTDHLTSSLAEKNQTINNGLISDANFVPNFDGFYHTSVIDLSSGVIFNLAKYFHKLILLDQPEEEWSSWKLLLSSYKLFVNLEENGYIVEFKTNKNIKKFIFREELLKNKSFCLYPWMNCVSEFGNIRLCARSNKNFDIKSDLSDWKTNENANDVRNKLLKNKRFPEMCKTCYDYEDRGVESYRTYESLDWLSILDINSFDDLKTIERPYYYEIRLKNTCNIMCRSCNPMLSSKIEKESKKYNLPIIYESNKNVSTTKIIPIDELTKKHRVYLTGGEPLVIKETYDFMEECIRKNRTDFHLTFSTNGTVASKKLLDLTKHFSNLNISLSVDGYGIINDYWRWGSKWETILKNIKLFEEQGHTISLNTVPGIYNVTNLHLLFQFADDYIPNATVYLQLNYEEEQTAFNHPNAELVVKSMENCKKTRLYYGDGKSCKSTVDSLYNYYSNNPICDLKMLKKFFDYNDKLDEIRGVRLKDYIPELEDARKYLNG